MKYPFLLLTSCLIFAGMPCAAFSAELKAPIKTAAEKPQDRKVFDAKSYILDNGLQVIVVENHRAPVVTHMVWYKAGAADEPRGKSGIAHFLEHLMFKGQKSKIFGDIPSGEFSKIIRTMGGQDNAFTSHDYTAYFQSVASDKLETVMKMEAGRMRGLDVPAGEFASENKVILEERRQRTDNDPRVQLSEQMNEILFPNHPYGIAIIGWLHEMAALTWDDAKTFYDQYYAPNNAILIVSGDVKAGDVHALAQKIYGKIEKRKVPARARTTSPPFIGHPAVTLKHESIREPAFVRTYRVPSQRQNPSAARALEVMQEIMGGGPSSRLYKNLVVDQKIVTGVSIDYDSSAWDDATLDISATPAQGKTLEQVKEAIDAQLRLLIQSGVEDTERAQAITRMQDQAVYARDSLSGPAMVIGYNMATGSTLDEIEHWPALIETVTKKEIQDVSNAYINPDGETQTPYVEGYLLPLESQKGDKK